MSGTGFGDASGVALAALQAKVAKGSWSRAAGIAMAFKLVKPAQRRWRSVNAPHLAARRTGTKFKDGKLLERSGADNQLQTAGEDEAPAAA